MDGLAGSAADMGGKIYSTSDGGKKWSTSRHDCWTGEVYGAVTHLGTITIAVGLGNICRAATLTGTFTDTAKKDGTSPITLTGVSLVKVSGKPEAITVGWRKLGATSWKHYVYYSVDQGKTWSDSSYLFSKTTQYIPEDVLLLPSGRAVGVGQKGFFHDFDPGKSSTTHTPLGSSSDKLFALARVQPSGGGNAHILVSGNASYFSDKDGTTFTTLKGKEVVPSLNAAAFNGKGKAYLGLSVSPGGLITSTW